MIFNILVASVGQIPPSCSQVLAECLVSPTVYWSKGDNGCTAYAQGWPQGNYYGTCHLCQSTSRSYSCCSLSECQAFCNDLYPSSCHGCISDCYTGCQYMDNHGAGALCTPSPPQLPLPSLPPPMLPPPSPQPPRAPRHLPPAPH